MSTEPARDPADAPVGEPPSVGAPLALAASDGSPGWPGPIVPRLFALSGLMVIVSTPLCGSFAFSGFRPEAVGFMYLGYGLFWFSPLVFGLATLLYVLGIGDPEGKRSAWSRGIAGVGLGLGLLGTLLFGLIVVGLRL